MQSLNIISVLADSYLHFKEKTNLFENKLIEYGQYGEGRSGRVKENFFYFVYGRKDARVIEPTN